MGRAPCCDKTKVKRGPWSPEEDNTLRNFVENHGTGGSWIALPQKAGLKRCGKSCRLRWLNYLRPNIKHGGFTLEEDTIILTLYHNIGSRWSVIASQLPGRTDNDVKNYWNTKLKKKLLPSTTTTSSSAATTSSLMSTPSMAETAYSNTLPYVSDVDHILNENVDGAYLSPPFSAASNHENGGVGGAASWNGWSEDDQALLVEFGSGLMAYDVMNFQENLNQYQMSYGYSPL